MSYQLYHENIMTTINDSKIGAAIASIFDSVTASDRLGLVAAGFASLNGAMTITSVFSGAYGDYEKEGRLAQLYYNFDGYTAIGYGIVSYYVVAGEEYLSAVAYGCLPLTLFLLSLLFTKRMQNYPDKKARNRFAAMVMLISLLIALNLSGEEYYANLLLQILSALGVLKSMRHIFSPEHVLSEFKYTWDPKNETWTKLSDGAEIEHKEATVAAIVDYGQTRLTFNSLLVALSFGMESAKAVGLSALVHAVCLAQSLMYPKTKAKVYAVPREIYLAIAVFVGWNLFLAETFENRNIILEG